MAEKKPDLDLSDQQLRLRAMQHTIETFRNVYGNLTDVDDVQITQRFDAIYGRMTGRDGPSTVDEVKR